MQKFQQLLTILNQIVWWSDLTEYKTTMLCQFDLLWNDNHTDWDKW